jgi:uncharacterized cupin superfamily protein
MSEEIEIINLPRILDSRGNLSFIEANKHIPFGIQRSYWIYDVPGGEARGGHAFRKQQEFIVALSGSFDVVLDKGNNPVRYSLNRSYYGLYVPAGVWRSMDNFSTNSLALVMASTKFDESDYIRDYNKFLEFTKAKTNSEVIYDKGIQSGYDVNKMQSSTVSDCKMIHFEKKHIVKGAITVAENDSTLPFATQRVYYLYDIPGGESRGGHAHKELQQLIVAASGSFDVLIDDGKKKEVISLNRPYYGLMIIPGIWRELINFSSGSICLVLANMNYNESDYIRNYSEFKKMKTHDS